MSLAPLVAAATVSFSKETKLVNVTFPVLEDRLTDQPPGKLLAAAPAAATQLWISWVAGSAPAADSGWLFSPNAEWKTVASHTSAVQLHPLLAMHPLAVSGTDSDLPTG